MVGQHDAARTYANAVRASCHVSQQDRGGSACNAGHAMVLGEPIAPVAQRLGMACQRQAVAKRLAGVTALHNRREVKH